jgi:hypothetical protein
MYQALVRIAKDDMTATTPDGAPPEGPRFDWAAFLNALLRLMREARAGGASPPR